MATKKIETIADKRFYDEPKGAKADSMVLLKNNCFPTVHQPLPQPDVKPADESGDNVEPCRVAKCEEQFAALNFTVSPDSADENLRHERVNADEFCRTRRYGNREAPKEGRYPQGDIRRRGDA